MNKKRHPFPSLGIIILILMVLLFMVGVFIASSTALWARRTIYEEHDRHLSELCSTVDHNISMLLDRCRMDMSSFVETDYLKAAEDSLYESGEKRSLIWQLKLNSLILTEYAEKILVVKDGEVVVSSSMRDVMNYTILPENDGDDVWLIINNETEKSYLALSCQSINYDYTYYALVDLKPFFERVVVDTIYEDHWVVLYDPGSGLTLQNDQMQPEYNVFTEEEIVSRDDGYARIYERTLSGSKGASDYNYGEDDLDDQSSRIYILPASSTENQIFSVAVAVYNGQIIVPMKRMTVLFVIAAILMAFSAAAALFLIFHNGKRAKEQEEEIAALAKEKKLSDELLRNQEQLIHHQKLETIGTLTAGIAHEFNNMLSPIMGYSMLILEKSRMNDQEVFDSALEVYEASERAKKLVSQISKLSRRQSVTQMKPISPEKLITDVLNMSAASVPGNIVVNTVIHTDCRILGDESQLGHMLLNLVINAIQAMSPDGGTLTVTAEADSNNVSISVADTGKGIPEKNLEAIFDPFFTTKEVGKGTGLGLSISQRIANNHSGTITAVNLPEGGARFTFTTFIFRQ